MKTTVSFITTVALCLIPFQAEAKKTHSERKIVNTPEQQLAGFTVPDGYVVELVASEKDGIVNPIDLAFDDAGRIWTQTARMYPLDPVKNIKWNVLLKLMDNPAEQERNPEFKRIKDLYQGKTKGTDEIIILSNIYGEGSPKVEKFATGLTIPQSILPYKNGAYVMQGSELFYLEDTDNDGISDKRTSVLTGFGFTDTHTMGHSLVRGPGGWVSFSQGALNKGEIQAVKSGESTRIDYSKIARFSLDGNHIQLVNAGLNNIWGFQLRSSGQWYMTEANDQGWSVTPADPLASFKGIGNQKLRDYQPFFPQLHRFRVGGTGISGLAFNDDLTGTFAEEYKDVAFLANPITSTINNVKIVRNADGTVTAKHLPDFLVSKDDWFRPVHIDFGPDGNLYVVDWYNKIVSHNEVHTTHPDRDKSHGRIWRIRPKTAAERTIPNLYKVESAKLIEHLQSPSAWERKAAWQQIADRQAKELIPQLKELVADTSANTLIRIAALWSLESLGDTDEALLAKLAQDNDAEIRREVLRAVVNLDVTPEFLATLLKSITKETHVLVRSQAIRSIEQLGKTNPALIDIAVSFCHPAAKDNNSGAGYEVNFERYLARRALEKYPEEFTAYLATSAAKSQPADNLIWAQQSLAKQTSSAFATQWKTLRKKPFTKETLVIISNLSGDQKVQKIVAPYFGSPKRARQIATVALENIAEAYSPPVGYPLAETVLQLLKSEQESDKILGLKLGRAYRITHLSPEFAALLPAAKTEALKSEIITALSYLPKSFAPEFKAIADDENNSASLRIQALSALTQSIGDQATPAIKQFLTEDKGLKTTLVDALGSTIQGCKALLALLADKQITSSDIPAKIVERITHLYKTDAGAIALEKLNVENEKNKTTEAKKRITTLEKYIAEKPGNPETGKAIFTGMCLTCHVVGKDGVGIGPALDGSGTRDLNHLLTAVLVPDEAAENAYILYRTIDAAGHITEGFKLKQDGRGTTLGFQGGLTQFTPKRTLAQEQFVGSKSFMPDTFSTLPETTIADIVAYIKTLK